MLYTCFKITLYIDVLHGDVLYDGALCADVLQVLECVISLTYVGCYIYRFVVVADVIEEIRSTYKEEFVDVSPVAFWDQVHVRVITCRFLWVLGSSIS